MRTSSGSIALATVAENLANALRALKLDNDDALQYENRAANIRRTLGIREKQ